MYGYQSSDLKILRYNHLRLNIIKFTHLFTLFSLHKYEKFYEIKKKRKKNKYI